MRDIMEHREKPGANGGPNNQEGQEENEEVELNPEDIVEVIELNEEQESEEDLAGDVGAMDLEEYGGEGAVAMEIKDDAAVVFTKHTGSVFCVCIGPQDSQMLAVTGGEDDKAYLWDIKTGEVFFECTGHKDSVTCAGFSHDGVYVATGDMSGLIQVWKVAERKFVWSFECSDLEWLEWHHGANVLLAGTVDGDTWMWKVPSGDCRTFQGHGCVSNSGKILPDGKRACVGYEDGVVKVWDLKAGTVLHSISGQNSHESSITSMDCHHENVVVITGSTDVTAKIINTQTGKVVSTLSCSHTGPEDNQEDSVEAVGFCRLQPLAATGTLTGILGIWDIPTQVLRQQCIHKDGIVRLRWDQSSPLLYTSTLEGVVHLWDARSGKQESQWSGHRAEVLDMDISRDGSFLITSSGDGTARVFSLHTPDR